MVIVGHGLSYALWIYFLLLIFRLIMDFVFQFARSYEPHGAMLVALEVTYTLTDPPLKLIRRFIPPLRHRWGRDRPGVPDPDHRRAGPAWRVVERVFSS